MIINQITPMELGVNSVTEIQTTDSSLFEGMVESINQVNELQTASSELKKEFVQGNEDVLLSDVMFESARADLAFNGLLEVRNKVMEAYKDVMNMAL